MLNSNPYMIYYYYWDSYMTMSYLTDFCFYSETMILHPNINYFLLDSKITFVILKELTLNMELDHDCSTTINCMMIMNFCYCHCANMYWCYMGICWNCCCLDLYDLTICYLLRKKSNCIVFHFVDCITTVY